MNALRPKRETLKIVYLLLLTIFFFGSAQDRGIGKPWMFFVDKIIPPAGPAKSAAFSKACFNALLQYLDTTTYQPILLRPGQTAASLSNRKKDIILSSDPSEYLKRGESMDTMVLWMNYVVGFTNAKITVPYTRGHSSNLPGWIAQKAYDALLSDFLGTLSLTAGPPGSTVLLEGGITFRPPVEFLLPPGRYMTITAFPGFISREDSIDIMPQRVTRKRILLLPLAN